MMMGHVNNARKLINLVYFINIDAYGKCKYFIENCLVYDFAVPICKVCCIGFHLGFFYNFQIKMDFAIKKLLIVLNKLKQIVKNAIMILFQVSF